MRKYFASGDQIAEIEGTVRNEDICSIGFVLDRWSVHDIANVWKLDRSAVIHNMS